MAEILGLGLVLVMDPPTALRLLLGLPLLAHLGWSALTSLPLGEVPGPPSGRGERRQNLELRSRVVSFLNEVQRVEQFVQDAKTAGLPREEVEKNLRSAERRIKTSAADVAKAVGRNGL